MSRHAVKCHSEEVRVLEPQVLGTFFQQQFCRAEKPRYFYVPGRVNLIGEHTDYNEGFVLPIAINMGILIAGLSRADRIIRIHSLSAHETISFNLDDRFNRQPGHWCNYVEGVARILEKRSYRLSGADLIIDANLPTGAGLSSSAALENAAALALLSLSHQSTADRVQIALSSQEAEHQYVGTQCGVMDQLVTALGQKDHALLIDCQSLRIQPIPMNLPAVAVVICDSRVKHELSTSAYNQRVEECNRGIRALQKALPDVKSARDLDQTIFEQYQHIITDEIVRKRIRHVVSENSRTLSMSQALSEGDKEQVGQLMYSSHESLKNDYEVSCPELDTLVDIARTLPGVIGARMTGGGFGGCTVNLVEASDLPEFIEYISARYQEAFGQSPGIYITQASEGMREVGAQKVFTQSELNELLNQVFERASDATQLNQLVDFIRSQMPAIIAPDVDSISKAALIHLSGQTLPAVAETSQGELKLTVSQEFGIRLYYRDQELTTNLQNIPFDYPWFLPDPDDPAKIAEYATAHVSRGSRGESPWPESQWPKIGGILQGEQNWPHPDAAFGPYQLEILKEEPHRAILLSLPPAIENGPLKSVNAYGVELKGLFMVISPHAVVMALQHENHSSEGLAWAPWLVLGFSVPREGTLTNPSTILAFPDPSASDALQDKMTKVWNYTEINGIKMALINPHAKTLNEPFKKLYRDVNWSILAFKGSDFIILTRSILRHDEQFFPFLEHGRYFIEVEHTGPRVISGEKSTVLIQHDIVPIADLTEGVIQKLSLQKGQFELDVRTILAIFVQRYQSGTLVSNYQG